MIKIVWLGQGGFLLEHRDFRLLIDPYISDCVNKKDGFARLYPFPIALSDLNPDLLLVTHDHMDHLDPEGVPLIREMYPICRYAGPDRSFSHFLKMGIPEKQIIKVSIGNRYQIGPFIVMPITALHSDPSSCRYCIEAEGKKIILTGDTKYDESLFTPTLQNADLLLICINGKLNNMNVNEALSYVKKIHPSAVLPMHIGLFIEYTADPVPFILGCKALKVKSFQMSPGKEFLI